MTSRTPDNTQAREWCWPWSHDWARWFDTHSADRVRSIDQKVVGIAIFQERRCKCCNAVQLRAANS